LIGKRPPHNFGRRRVVRQQDRWREPENRGARRVEQCPCPGLPTGSNAQVGGAGPSEVNASYKGGLTSGSSSPDSRQSSVCEGEWAVWVETIAKAVGLSTSRLEHLFKEQIGTPMRSFRTWCRFRAAAVALATELRPHQGCRRGRILRSNLFHEDLPSGVRYHTVICFLLGSFDPRHGQGTA
jgi:hypothetical protein